VYKDDLEISRLLKKSESPQTYNTMRMKTPIGEHRIKAKTGDNVENTI
jgi:hypothetical protein